MARINLATNSKKIVYMKIVVPFLLDFVNIVNVIFDEIISKSKPKNPQEGNL